MNQYHKKTTKAALVRAIKEAELVASANGAKGVTVVFLSQTDKPMVSGVALSYFAAAYGEGRTGLVNKSGGFVRGLKNEFESESAKFFQVLPYVL